MSIGLAHQPVTSDRRGHLDSVVTHLACQSLTAILLALAFPKPGWSILAFVALVPAAWIALRTHRPRRLLWTSFLIASIWWLVMIGWLIPVTGGGYAALAIYMALYTPASLFFVRWIHQRIHASAVLALPMVWVSFEVMRSQFLQGGFGWFALAHSQAPIDPSQGAPRLAQIADLFGQHSVSFLVAMTNGLIVDLLTLPRGGSHALISSRSRFTRQRPASILLWLVAFVGAWFYGEFRIRETARLPQQTLRVAVIQTNESVSNTSDYRPGDVLAQWDRLRQLTLGVASQPRPPQLILWPESAVPASLNPEALAYYRTTSNYQRGLEGFENQVRETARLISAHLIVGASAADDWRPVTIQGLSYELPATRFNSAYLYRPDGSQFPQRYDKMHLVPFGEYTPWVEDLPGLKKLFIKYLTPYDFDYTVSRGREAVVFPLAGIDMDPAPRVATPICFEDVIPGVCREMTYEPTGEKRADLLCNITNDGWYPGFHQGAQHFQIAVFRCIENRIPMARSVNTGVSGFISSVGEVGPIVEDSDGKRQLIDGVAVHDMQFDPRATFFGRFGHVPMWCLCGLTALLAAAGVLRKSAA